jgi:hypothetical protein
LVGGKPIDPNNLYNSNSDFVANGGSDAFVKAIPQITNGYLMRDAIFDYIKLLKTKEKIFHQRTE